MNNIWILAQGPAAEAPSMVTSEPAGGQESSTTIVSSAPNVPGGAAPPRKPTGISSLLLLGLMFVVMYFLLFRGPRKQQQKRKQMVQTLKKNDRVQTIGGIIGTVVDIRGDEITLKIDESNNTKIKIVSSAIGKNLSKDKE